MGRRVPRHPGPRPSTSEELDELPAEVWPRNAARGADGVLRLAGVDVRDLAERFGTPLFVVDEADFRARCAERRLLDSCTTIVEESIEDYARGGTDDIETWMGLRPR